MPEKRPEAPVRNTPLPSGERALIAALRAQAAGSLSRGVRVGIGDDCAVLRVPRGHELAVTTDLLLETTHFRRDWHTPEATGHRCLARGLSDLAAMGAAPLAAFLSFAVPRELTGAWTTRFLDGLLALARASGVTLAGGDTAQAPVNHGHPLFSADIVLIGSAPSGTALLRSAARPGDLLYVTGAVGGSAAELAALSRTPAKFRKLRAASPNHPHLFPMPRLAQGKRLRPLASAAIDISDGISTDLAHLCEASGVRAEIEAARLPIHALAQGAPDPLGLALHGGEDYELLFAAPASARVPRSIAGVAIHRIGRILRGSKGAPQITLLGQDGQRTALSNQGWEHFTR